MTEPTDAELVAALRRGSREAAGRLAERYLRPCRAVALAIVGEIAGAEDVCQDAFVYALARIDDCRDPSRFGAWLLQIVRNRSRNHVRDGKVRSADPIERAGLVSVSPSPERMAEISEMRDRLLSALRELPEERREVVLLHDLEGWTHRQIAQRMGLPVGTVASHLHHARKRLREILRDREEDE